MRSCVRNHKKRVVGWRVTGFVLLAVGLHCTAPLAVQGGSGEWIDRGVLLVRHQGVPHGLMHSLGRKGSGLCPQTRLTPNAPDEFYNQKNPLPATQENIDAGRALYHVDSQPTACKICHGAEGNGFGMMAQGLFPMPRNFTCAETMKDIPDGQMFWIIRNGSSGTGMLPYGGLSDKQIWQLVHYLRKFAE